MGWKIKLRKFLRSWNKKREVKKRREKQFSFKSRIHKTDPKRILKRTKKMEGRKNLSKK